MKKMLDVTVHVLWHQACQLILIQNNIENLHQGLHHQPMQPYQNHMLK